MPGHTKVKAELTHYNRDRHNASCTVAASPMVRPDTYVTLRTGYMGNMFWTEGSSIDALQIKVHKTNQPDVVLLFLTADRSNRSRIHFEAEHSQPLPAGWMLT
jgi:hypothetical protein